MSCSVLRNIFSGITPSLLMSLWLCVSWPAAQPAAKENHCDPDLQHHRDNPLGYRLRQDRCEGIYIKEVVSKTLMVVSLTKSFEDYDLSTGKELLIKWTTPGKCNIYLRAQSLRRRLHYRMDTSRAPQPTQYKWPLEILAALKIVRNDIGVIGWTTYTINGTDRKVYIPLRIMQQTEKFPSESYALVLLPGRELKEVFVSLAPLKADGNTGPFITDGKALGYGYYPAGRGFAIPIHGIKKPGIYYLEIGATLKSGGNDAVELLLYHPGR